MRPERQRELEVGADLGFYGGRIGIETTLYTQRTTDLLLNVELPLTSGFSNQLQNVGELSNNGIELLVRALPVVTNDFNWSSTVTFATNRNRIDLDPAVEATTRRRRTPTRRRSSWATPSGSWP